MIINWGLHRLDFSPIWNRLWSAVKDEVFTFPGYDNRPLKELAAYTRGVYNSVHVRYLIGIATDRPLYKEMLINTQFI